VGPAHLVNYLNRLRAPFNVSLISQEAAICGLTDKKHLHDVVTLNNQQRVRLSAGLAQWGRVFPSQANFILVDFARPSAQIYDALLDEGVIVRPIPGLATHLRVTIGTVTENERLLGALGKVMQKLS
jgi:histidinol-phosphate aminotransferase